MEPVIGDMESFIRMIGHLITSDNEVQDDEWRAVETRLLSLHRDLERLWQAAFDEWRRESEAHEAALAAAKARTAPGSQADLKRVETWWRMLAAAASSALDAAHEAMPEGTRALVGDAAKLRHAVAPIDAGLPPAESGRAQA